MFKKVILFGGSFDPPHEGHKELVAHVSKIFNPEKIIVIPCSIQPLKDAQPTSAQKRLDMTRHMFPGKEFLVSDYEINKSGVSYSIDTVTHFKKIFTNSEICFLMGEDSFLDIKRWKDYENLLKICSYIVVARTKDDSAKLKIFVKEIKDKYSTDVNIVDDFYHPASSTEIRAELLKGIGSKYLTPEVLKYIRTNSLYKE